GEPLMRPLLLDFPDHPNVHKCQEEFLFGRQLLVAPVLTAGAKHRCIRLPAGTWYEFPVWPQGARAGKRVGRLEPERVAGIRTGRAQAVEHDIPVTIDSMPVLARAGAIIPMQPVRQYADQAAAPELIFELFPGD